MELGFNATATIMRFRQIAAEAGDALLTEGDVQPDHELLDMCADALHHLTHARRAMDARDFCNWPMRDKDPVGYAAARKTDEALMAEFCAGEKEGKNPLYWIAKKKAMTPAGIYAKATIVRASKTGAAGLAMSLAADLLDCKELRQTPGRLRGRRRSYATTPLGVRQRQKPRPRLRSVPSIPDPVRAGFQCLDPRSQANLSR